MELRAQDYWETPSAQSPILFVPFTLQPDSGWTHSVVFYNGFSRAQEKDYRAKLSPLSADIAAKLEARQELDKTPVIAEDRFVQPFIALFEQLFIWFPGEYVAELVVEAEPGSASFSKSYRFTLFESDTADLRRYADDFKYGGGLTFNVKAHAGLSVQIVSHVNALNSLPA
jgi:hypothetical protein